MTDEDIFGLIVTGAILALTLIGLIVATWYWRQPPQRYCSTCGSENAVGVVIIYDGKTGRPRRHRWGVACPESRMRFEGERGWSGNGNVHQHYYSMYNDEPPAWLAEDIRQILIGRARGATSLHTPSEVRTLYGRE